MQEWKITFNAANGSLTFFDLDMVMDFLASVGVPLPQRTAQELRDDVWWRVALHKNGEAVGQLERLG